MTKANGVSEKVAVLVRCFSVFTLVLLIWVASPIWASEEKENTARETTESTEEGSGEQAEPEYNNKLKWSTASEVDNFGFDIYRSDAEEGPFERINPEPIPGQGTTDEPTFYEYIDDTIDPTQAYYYYIESISLSNEREKFTPTFRAKPKKPAEE